jgi:hypothetical protein
MTGGAAPERNSLEIVRLRQRLGRSRRRAPGVAEDVCVAGLLDQHQRELSRVIADRSPRRLAARIEGGTAVTEGDKCNREFLHAVGADQSGEAASGKRV